MRPLAGLARQVQAKLEIGATNDPHEHEADAIAREVVSKLARRAANEPADGAEFEIGSSTPLIARVPRGGGIGTDGGVAEPAVEQALQTASVGGDALPDTVRRDMESALGTDLSDVRVHTGAQSTELNDEISARAFTKGNHIFFRDGLPDAASASGQDLLAHELVHTVQQASPVHRSVDTVRRKGDAPAKVLDPIDDWLEFSKVSGAFGAKTRSKELKEIDRTLAVWKGSGRTMAGNLKQNVDQLTAILDAIETWQKSKKDGNSIRSGPVAALANLVRPVAQTFTDRALKKQQNDSISGPLFAEFKKIDPRSGRFAGKNTTDVKQDRFEPDNQTAGLMAQTKKHDDGSLTDEALDELDQEQIEDAKKLVEVSRRCGVQVDPTVSAEKVRELMGSKEYENELTGRTRVPELENHTDPNAEVSAEVTEDVDGVKVTYDKSDVHAGERLASLRKALKMINSTKAQVPPTLTVYFPKFGREISIADDCSVKFGAKIADAVFHPPNFLAVSSANTGNAKTDTVQGELKFLSAQLGADDALVHTIIHEIGHAIHYHNDRGRFYSLNFAFFKGKTFNGKSYQDIAAKEVSQYGSNPREMVAEVFVGTVTGKKEFSDTVWEMYNAFGGFDPR